MNNPMAVLVNLNQSKDNGVDNWNTPRQVAYSRTGNNTIVEHDSEIFPGARAAANLKEEEWD